VLALAAAAEPHDGGGAVPLARRLEHAIDLGELAAVVHDEEVAAVGLGLLRGDERLVIDHDGDRAARRRALAHDDLAAEREGVEGADRGRATLPLGWRVALRAAGAEEQQHDDSLKHASSS
jgi:hypothetical protein